MANAFGAFGVPLDQPGDYDEEASALQRRRMQLLNAMNTPVGNARSGWGGGIANFLQGALGNASLGKLDQQNKDLAARRDEFAQNALTKLGQIDKPAVPAVPGVNDMPPPAVNEMGPVAPTSPTMMEPSGPDGGMIPTNKFVPAQPAQPMIPGSMTDRVKLLSQMSQGGPMYQAIAKHTMTQALEAPEKAKVAAQAAIEKKDAQDRAAADRQYEASIKASDRQFEKDRDNAAKAEREAAAMQARKEMAADRNATLTAIRAAAGGGKGQLSPLTDEDGTPLVFHPTTNTLTRVGTGEPPKGAPTSRIGAEKGAQSVRDIDATIARGDEALKMLAANPGAFGGIKAIGGAIAGVAPDALESMAKEKLYSPEETATQTFIAREGAQILKDLYGAALTKNESSRAAPFEYKAGDTPERIASKIRGMMKIFESKAGAQSPAAKALARPGAAPAAPTSDLRSKYGL